MNVKLCVKQMHEIKQRLDKLNKKYDKRRKYLIKQSEKQMSNGTFMVDDLVAKVSKSVRINYSINKLKNKLPKVQFRQITNKHYSVSNPKLLFEVAMKYGIPKETLKKCISYDYTLNEQKLDDLFEIGEITLEEIAGCYEVVPSRTMVTIKTVAREAYED